MKKHFQAMTFLDRYLAVTIALLLSFTAQSQTLYVPLNPESVKIPFTVNGVVRYDTVGDLTRNKVSKSDSTLFSTKANGTKQRDSVFAILNASKKNVIDSGYGKGLAAYASIGTLGKVRDSLATLSGGSAANSTIPADYLISTNGTTITATPKTGSGLGTFSGTNAATVTNSAIAALTTGGHIVLTKGAYTVSTSIIDAGISGITITLQQGAKLVAANALNAPVIWLTDVNNWTINNPEIDGNAINQGTPTYAGTILADGIFLHSSNNSIVNNPNIYNCRRMGVNVDGISQNTGVNGGLVHDCNWNGITLGENSNGKDLFARNVHIYNCSDCAVSTYGVRTVITGNTIHDILTTTGYNSSHWGIAIETTDNTGDHNIVKRNTIYNVWVGINVAINCNNNTLTDNEIFNWDLSNEYRPAIWLFSNYNTVQGNVSEKLTNNGIGITLAGTASYNYVDHNKSTSYTGVNMDGSASYNTVTNNWSKSTSYGINVNTATCLGNRIDGNDWSQSASDLNNTGVGTIIGGNFWKSGYIITATLTNLNASNLTSGTAPPARLGTGTPSSSNYLRGDGTWSAVSGGGGSTALSSNTAKGLSAMGNPTKAWTLGVPYIGASLYSSAIDENAVIYNAVYLDTASTITGAIIPLTTQGVYTAGAYNGVALYSVSGSTLTRVAMSVDDPAIWKAASGTLIRKAFSATYAAQPGLYYVAYVYSRTAVTTAPAISKVSVAFNAMITTGFTNGNILSANAYGDGVTPPLSKSMSTDFTNYGGLTLVGIY